jgi:hypothetical protein
MVRRKAYKKAQFYIISTIAVLLLTYGLLSLMQTTVTFDLYPPIAASGALLNTKITEDMEYLNNTHDPKELDLLIPWYFDSLSKKVVLRDMKLSWYYNSSANPRYVVYEIVSSDFYLKKRIFFR